MYVVSLWLVVIYFITVIYTIFNWKWWEETFGVRLPFAVQTCTVWHCWRLTAIRRRDKCAHDNHRHFQRKRCLRGKHWTRPKFYVWKHYRWNFAALARPFSVVVDVVVETVVDTDVVVAARLDSKWTVVGNLQKEHAKINSQSSFMCILKKTYLQTCCWSTVVVAAAVDTVVVGSC